jgi:hypothetical protein
MFRRSLVLLSQKTTSRTVVRDPRKRNKRMAVIVEESKQHQNNNSVQPYQRNNLPFEPSLQNQQSLGSSMVSYAFAGAGMTLGFVLVGAILGF